MAIKNEFIKTFNLVLVIAKCLISKKNAYGNTSVKTMIDIGNIRYQQTSLYLQNSFSIHFIT